jgi:hypothetical protein
MTKPSVTANKTKDRWNAAHYTQIKVSVKPDTAETFKVACAANEVSMASVLAKFMESYSNPANKKPGNNAASPDPFTTRRKRRLTVKKMVAQMEQLIAAEEAYKENIPENLQGAKWYEAAEQSLEYMQEALDLLESIY